jgi:hypothetical protein
LAQSLLRYKKNEDVWGTGVFLTPKQDQGGEQLHVPTGHEAG